MNKSLPRIIALAAAGLLVAACAQPFADDAGPAAARAARLPAPAGTEVPHFFFLPPLAPPMTGTGTFAADVEPVVRVALADGELVTPLAEFTVEGSAKERVRVDATDPAGEFWIVNLDLRRHPAPAWSVLRIEVLVDGKILGSLEALVVPNGAAKASAAGTLALVAGRTVPVKFRIEEELFERRQGIIEVWNPSGNALELWAVPAYDDFVAVAVGAYHATGLRADGTLVSWGDDRNGAVSGTPTDGGYVAVDAGLLYTLALKEDGTVVSWGAGLADMPAAPTGSGYTAIGAGFGFAYGILEDGTLQAWNSSGSATPTAGGFGSVKAGSSIAAALDGSGAATLWGSNAGVAGAPIPAGAFAAIDVGYYHAAGVLADGRLVSWGAAASGYGLAQDFGDGPYVAVAAGKFAGIGLRADGSLKAYGSSSIVTEVPVGSYGYIAVAASPLDTLVAIRLPEYVVY